MDALDKQIARMMKWQQRAMVPVVVVLFLSLAQLLLAHGGYADGAPAIALGLAGVVVLFVAIILFLITLWHIFQTARMAFGVRAGLGYAVVAAVLALWPGLLVIPLWAGLFVVPNMVRLDIMRWHRLESESAGDEQDLATSGHHS